MDLVDRGGPARPGVFNVVQGIGEEVGRRPRGRPARATHLLHRLARDRPRRSASPRRGTWCRSPPSSAARGRSSSSPTPTSTPPRQKAAVMYDDAGQVCLAGTRLLVEASVRDEFLDRFDARHRAPRARRQPRPGDHRVAADPPRAPRPGRGLRRARARRRRHRRLRRHAARARRRPLVPADAHRAALQRLRDRPARGLRPGAHPPDLHRRGPRRSRSPTRPRTASRRSSTPPTAPRPTASGPAAARRHHLGQLLPRARPHRALRGHRASAASDARAATTPSTSTAT